MRLPSRDQLGTQAVDASGEALKDSDLERFKELAGLLLVKVKDHRRNAWLMGDYFLEIRNKIGFGYYIKFVEEYLHTSKMTALRYTNVRQCWESADGVPHDKPMEEIYAIAAEFKRQQKLEERAQRLGLTWAEYRHRLESEKEMKQHHVSQLQNQIGMAEELAEEASRNLEQAKTVKDDHGDLAIDAGLPWAPPKDWDLEDHFEAVNQYASHVIILTREGWPRGEDRNQLLDSMRYLRDKIDAFFERHEPIEPVDDPVDDGGDIDIGDGDDLEQQPVDVPFEVDEELQPA